MKKCVRLIGLLSTLVFVLINWGSPVFALDMDLVELLTKNLGVTNQQAEGGAGAIFNAASENMSLEDFAKVTDAMPEVKSLMNAAPKVKTGSGSGGLSSMLTKAGGSMGTLAGLASTFSNLGLGGDMVGKFIPIVLDYAQSNGGEAIASLLKTALQ
jgi:hypothetical protein